MLFQNVASSKKNSNKSDPYKTITITIWSPHSGGSTTIAACLFFYLARYTNHKITIMDFDIYKPELSVYLGINFTPEGMGEESKNSGSLNIMCDAITRNQFTNEVYSELIVPFGRNFVITGNSSLCDCENIWNGDSKSNFFKNTGKDSFSYYDNIFKMSKETSNIVIVDCSSNVFMDSTKYFLNYSDYCLVVVNANDSKLINAKILLNHCKTNFGMGKDRVFVLVNKFNSYNVSMFKVREILKGWIVVGHIKYKPEYQYACDEGKLGKIFHKDGGIYGDIIKRWRL